MAYFSDKGRYLYLLALGIGILIAIAIVLLFLIRVGPSTRKNTLNKITVAQVSDFFLYAPLYIAKDAGFFADNGLDVNIVNTGGDEKTWAAVFTGQADFGVGDPTFVAIAGSRGEPGAVIASLVNGVPFWGVTFDPNVPEIARPSDLDHYIVATFPAPSTAYTLQKKNV